MAEHKSQEMIVHIIASMVLDISRKHLELFPPAAARRTITVIKRRVTQEGLGFLTKTLPSLGKALDQAMSGNTPLQLCRFSKRTGSQLPRFLGELFEAVLLNDGTLRNDPNVLVYRTLRQVLYLFYKYELPYSAVQQEEVLSSFLRTEEELPLPDNSPVDPLCNVSQGSTTDSVCSEPEAANVLYKAKQLLSELLANYDPLNITPRHGPGAVATGEKAWDKMSFKRLYTPLNEVYPYDAYFYASLAHVCDEMQSLEKYQVLPYSTAKVSLVPKDSRGPRLISCEPLEVQWIQQGIMRSLVRHVEGHSLTRGIVNFTDQTINRNIALTSSVTGEYATLDLKEASDRVSLSLVRRLFPDHVLRALEATRSSRTQLPSGRVVELRKFAPMGSGLCFPVLALTIWSLITAYAVLSRRVTKLQASRSIRVYGDDVIVPTAQAEDAIRVLESFHLKVNRAKSFCKGSFRESCGLDAFKGIEVQPVRIKTVWTSYRDTSAFESWIAYANSLESNGYALTAQLIADHVLALYGPVPWNEQKLAEMPYPMFSFNPYAETECRARYNAKLQRIERLVWVSKSKQVRLRSYNSWSELLRFLTTGGEGFRAGVYAMRKASLLVKRWR